MRNTQSRSVDNFNPFRALPDFLILLSDADDLTRHFKGRRLGQERFNPFGRTPFYQEVKFIEFILISKNVHWGNVYGTLMKCLLPI